MVNTKTNTLNSSLATTHNPISLIITWCHLIVSQETGLIQWFKVDQPDLIMNEKDKENAKLTILDTVEKEFNLDLTIGETSELEQIAHMQYNKQYTQMIMASSTGIIGRLEVAADKLNDDDDEEDQN